MRVLIALALALVSGCFNPKITQCQFKCGSGGGCPSGTNCVDGECLTNDGICPGATCMVTPPANCATPVVIDSVDCAAPCATVMAQSAADTLCTTSGWRLAILDAPAKLANAPVPASDALWVGAHRQGNTGNLFVWSDGTTVATSAWAPSFPSATAGLDCVVIDGASHQLENRDCGTSLTINQHRALCDHD
jgi:hypothetical protein